MTFVKKITRTNKDGTTKTYYAEVKSVRVNGKPRHKYIRSLGTDPDNPTTFPITTTEFKQLAERLAKDDCTPQDMFEMLEKMGHPVTREELARIGITYEFKKKTFSTSLSYKRS